MWWNVATLSTRSKASSSNGSAVPDPSTATTSGVRERRISSIPGDGSIPVIA